MWSLRRPPMRIVGGLDIHRRQITFDYLDERSGQSRRGRIAPADRMLLRRWLEATIDGAPAAFAVEACTGWRFVVEELQRAGIEAHLAEPADTAAARGPKRRAKTDRTDARHLRELLAAGRLPESWIPPEQVLEMRARLQLFKDLREEHTAWVQRIHAILLHQGAPALTGDLLGADNRRRLPAGEQLSPAGREAVATALRMLDALDAELTPLRRQIAAFARRQPGCQALQAQYGWGRSPRQRCGPNSATPAGSPPPARRCGTPAWTSPSTPPTANGRRASCPARAHRCCAGRCSRRPSARPGRAPRITPTTGRSPTASVVTGRRSRLPARSPAGHTTPCAPWARRPSPPSDYRVLVRASAHPPMPAARSCRPPATRPRDVIGLKRPSGRIPAGTPHRSSCRRSQPLHDGCVHRDKAGRPRTAPLPATPPALAPRPGAAIDVTPPLRPVPRRPASAGPRRGQGRSSTGRSTLTAAAGRHNPKPADEANNNRSVDRGSHHR